MVLLVKMVGERLNVTQILIVRQVIMMLIVMPKVLNQFPGCLKTQRLDLQIIRVVFALIAMLCGFYAVINMPLADAIAIGFAKSFFRHDLCHMDIEGSGGYPPLAGCGYGFCRRSRDDAPRAGWL